MISPGRRAALLVAAVLGLVLTAGCGAKTGPGDRTALGQTAAGVTGAYFPATMAQVADGADFQQTIGTLQKELFDACIRGYGFGPQAQAIAFSNLNLMPFQAMSGYVQNQNAAVGLVDLRAVAHSGMLAPLYIMATRPDTSGVSPAELRAVESDQWRCWSRSRQAVTKLERQGAALQRQWNAQEIRLLDSRPVRAATKVFSSCVTHEGAPRGASESLRQFIGWLQQMVNRAEWASRMGGPQPAAQPRQAMDAHWTRVFLKCATPLVSLLQRQLPGVQQTFLQEHYGQILALEKTANQTVSTLEHLTESEYR